VFAHFYFDMGPRPTLKHSLDRIDTDGDYGPENCRWATASEQQRNKENVPKVRIGDIEASVAEWCERLGRRGSTIRSRIYCHGWDPVRAITTPIRPTRSRSAQ
jgi:hypothetical protein